MKKDKVKNLILLIKFQIKQDNFKINLKFFYILNKKLTNYYNQNKLRKLKNKKSFNKNLNKFK